MAVLPVGCGVDSRTCTMQSRTPQMHQMHQLTSPRGACHSWQNCVPPAAVYWPHQMGLVSSTLPQPAAAATARLAPMPSSSCRRLPDPARVPASRCFRFTAASRSSEYLRAASSLAGSALVRPMSAVAAVCSAGCTQKCSSKSQRRREGRSGGRTGRSRRPETRQCPAPTLAGQSTVP